MRPKTREGFMLARHLLTTLALLLSLPLPAAECRLRMVYPDQEAAPLYLGSGTTVPEPPGLVVELARSASVAAGCALDLARFPARRALALVRSGDADLMGLPLMAGMTGLALPPDQGEVPGRERGLPMVLRVYVLARQMPPAATPNSEFIRGKRLGIAMGTYGDIWLGEERLEAESVPGIDQNLAKLRNGRLDAFIANPLLMEAALARPENAEVVALPEVLAHFHANFVFSTRFAHAHPEQVTRFWDWVDRNARAEFARLRAARYQAAGR